MQISTVFCDSPKNAISEMEADCIKIESTHLFSCSRCTLNCFAMCLIRLTIVFFIHPAIFLIVMIVLLAWAIARSFTHLLRRHRNRVKF